jgi:signal transduction histidine kinase
MLVVDDEYSIREALGMFFDNRGFSVSKADNGAAALDYLEKEDFDIILSDIRMDNLNGVDLVKKLRTFDKNTPVILMTAYPAVDTAVDALRNGVTDYITKPFNMEEMKQKIDAAIEKRNENLEQKYVQMYVDKNADFLDGISREVFNPLTPIDGYLTLLLKKEFGDIPEQQRKILSIIKKNSNKLKLFVNDLLLLYRIENAGMKPDFSVDVNPSDLIQEAVSQLEYEVEYRKQTVEINIFDQDARAFCDMQMIERVIYHLLDNALKFSPNRSAIRVSSERSMFMNEGYLKISVQDKSFRINPEDKRLVFSKFYNYVSCVSFGKHASSSDGMGLGLTLSSRIIELHKGKIWIEDGRHELSGGNVFSVMLPLSEKRAAKSN